VIDDPLIGRQLANFRVERALGRGGMAQVYYGQDVKLQRPVAIKVIDARYRGNPTYAQRFVREAQAIAKWRHEHIIQIHYADDEDGLYYFVMEYIDGQDLGQLIAHYAAQGQLVPPAEVLRIGRAIASALDYAHQRGVVHRDVKPSNVLMAQDGRVVLADFGLAMDTEQGSMGEVFGSAHYVAPEQARNSADAVPQSDLYSLGIILYEMLTGQVPFDDPSSTALAIQHLTQPPPLPRELNPDLNEATEAVLLKALSKTAAERYQTGRELLDALAAALPVDLSNPATLTQRMASPTQSKIEKTTDSQPAAPSAPAVHNRPIYLGVAGIGLALVLITLCLALGAAFWWLRSPEEAANLNQAASATPALLPPALVTSETAPSANPLPLTEPTPPAPASYDFLIAKRGEDSLFVVNLTPVPFPLASLRLGNEKGGLTGADWGMPLLDNGACVMAQKSEGKPKMPDVNCTEVGQPLGFSGKERFWGDSFEVYYGEQWLGICDKEQELCTFNTAAIFTPPAENDNEEDNKKNDKDD